MDGSSASSPFLQIDGFARTVHRISRSASKGECFPVLIVHVFGVDRLCASIGHIATNQLLDLFHGKLDSLVRDDDTVERIADRKFVLVLKGPTNTDHVRIAANQIQHTLSELCAENGVPIDVSAGVGAAFCPRNSSEATDLMKYAELAAIDGIEKQESLSFYDDCEAIALFTDCGLNTRLERAIRNGDLQLHYQPKLCLKSERIVGAEALLRWFDPVIGAISPDIVVRLAESTGRIHEVTRFVIQTACRQLSEWQPSLSSCCIAVNVTPSTILNRDAVEALRSATTYWGIDAARVTLEVTESAVMKARDVSHRALIEARELGARVSIDDFGTGFSSFACLKDIPADELKIDRSFVMGMVSDSNDRKIVAHTISIARSFGLDVVAEGVDSTESLRMLRRLGCDLAQGYCVSKPLPAEDFVEFYCRRNRATSNGQI